LLLNYPQKLQKLLRNLPGFQKTNESIAGNPDTKKPQFKPKGRWGSFVCERSKQRGSHPHTQTIIRRHLCAGLMDAGRLMGVLISDTSSLEFAVRLRLSDAPERAHVTLQWSSRVCIHVIAHDIASDI